ncbi:MAG TPA: hypothetical protein VIQ29_04480 [Ancylobacter sp.]
MSVELELSESIATRAMLQTLIGHFALAQEAKGEQTADEWVAEFREDCLRTARKAQFEGSRDVDANKLVRRTVENINVALDGLKFGGTVGD